MEIIQKNIDELIEYENNPRDNRQAVDKVAESIRQFGFINPIAIDKNNIIISGHTRIKAARMLGMENVPCIVHDLDEDDSRLVRIIDNKSNEYATWDIPSLYAELESVDSSDRNHFFTVPKNKKYYTTNKIIGFGNIEISISDEDYQLIKAIYDNYINTNKSYIGFINFLLGDKHV